MRKQRIDQTLMMNRITVKKRVGEEGVSGLRSLYKTVQIWGKKMLFVWQRQTEKKDWPATTTTMIDGDDR